MRVRPLRHLCKQPLYYISFFLKNQLFLCRFSEKSRAISKETAPLVLLSLQQRNQKLRRQNDQYQRYVISRGIRRRNVVRFRRRDQRSERGRRRHTARDRAEVIQKRKF